MRNHKYLILLTAFLVAAGSIFAGGGNRNGTAGATQLLIPVGARGIAMGGAVLTNSYGVDGLFWNPANLSRANNNTEVMFSHMNHIADIGVEYGVLGVNINGFGALGLSIKTLDVGDIPITTTDAPDGNGAFFTPQFVTVGVTYSKMLSDRVSVGVTGKFISETMDEVSASGVAFDAGVTYNNLLNVEGLTMAVVMKNIGPQMEYSGSGLLANANVPNFERPDQYYTIKAAGYELPSSLEIGLGYQLNFNEQNAFTAATAFQNHNFWGDEYRLGGEYAFNDLFFVRGGYTLTPQLEDDQNIYGFTAGAGLKYDLGGFLVKFDYAYRQVEFDALGNNHVFSLDLGL